MFLFATPRIHTQQMFSRIWNCNVNASMISYIPFHKTHQGWPFILNCMAIHHLTPPSDAYMRQWIGSASVQIMACAYSAPSHYLNQCWYIVNWTLGNTLQWNLNQNTNFSFHKSAFENIVCEMAAILFRGRWIKCPFVTSVSRIMMPCRYIILFWPITHALYNCCVKINTSLLQIKHGM